MLGDGSAGGRREVERALGLRTRKGPRSTIRMTPMMRAILSVTDAGRTLRMQEDEDEEEETEEGPLTSGSDHIIPHDHDFCDRVVINVSGLRFETQLRTLNQFPDTLLGDPARRIRYYDPDEDEYYFDRHQDSFKSVLYYYQSGGRLRRPNNVPLDVFSDEVKFFELGELAMNRFREDEGVLEDEDKPLPSNELQRRVWILFEYPESSIHARLLAIISMVIIILSICIFVMETHPKYNRYRRSTQPESPSPNSTRPESARQVKSNENMPVPDPFFLMETMCMSWFTFELVVRFLSCPDKFAFFKSVFNLVDLLATIPYLVTLGMVVAEKEELLVTKPLSPPTPTDRSANWAMFLTVFRAIRLLRIFRVLKLTGHAKNLKIIGKALRSSATQLSLVFFLYLGGVLFFATGAFFTETRDCDVNGVATVLAEDGVTETLEACYMSISHAIEWAVVTLTTLGSPIPYNPVGFWGILNATLCTVTGVLIVAITTAVVVFNLTYYYHREAEKEDIKSQNYNHVSSCPYMVESIDDDDGVEEGD